MFEPADAYEESSDPSAAAAAIFGFAPRGEVSAAA